MDLLFQRITSNSKLWLFQRKTARHLLNGKNVILSAPTGAGKTWAALISYLFSRYRGQPHVDKVIYALPLRTLATSLYNSTRKDCEEVFKLQDDLWKPRGFDELAITIQTGEQQNDPLFLGDICFTTIDQLLSSYLNIPYSVSDRMANINAGALLGSLIIIDEIHLLESDKSLWTLLEMVKRLKPYTRFLFMTATLSTLAIEKIAKHLNAEIVPVTHDELSQMPSHSNKQRTYRWIKETLTAQSIMKRYEDGRCLVICNTVSKAQQIYNDLRELVPKDCKVLLLHSRFYPEDRRCKEQSLNNYFGKYSNESNVILVATQVVEAGIDISAENLHTELCPANSLLQRAGRCARYEDRNRGTVWVYELEQTEDGKHKVGPYRGKDSALFVDLTRKGICLRDGRVLHFEDEQKLVDEVHEKTEIQLIKLLLKELNNRQLEVNQTIEQGGTGNVPRLIRNVQSVSVVIAKNPEEIDLNKGPVMLSIPRTSLYSLKDVFEAGTIEGWIAKVPIRLENNSDYEDTYTWQELKTPQELDRVSWLVALSPEVAAYDGDIGFRLGIGGLPRPVDYWPSSVLASYSYDFETYQEHVLKVIKRSRESSSRCRKASQLLEQALGLPINLTEWLADLTCGFHDVGKLSERWFKGSWSWQKDHYPEEIRCGEEQPLAHCTYRPDNGDWQKQRLNKYERGNHALEGAFGCYRAINDLILSKVGSEELANTLTKIMVTAIGQHHKTRAKNVEKFSFIENVQDWVNLSLRHCDMDYQINGLTTCNSETDKVRFQQNQLLSLTADKKRFPLYWYLVRRLRLADQEAMKER